MFRLIAIFISVFGIGLTSLPAFSSLPVTRRTRSLKSRYIEDTAIKNGTQIPMIPIEMTKIEQINASLIKITFLGRTDARGLRNDDDRLITTYVHRDSNNNNSDRDFFIIKSLKRKPDNEEIVTLINQNSGGGVRRHRSKHPDGSGSERAKRRIILPFGPRFEEQWQKY